MPLEDLDTLALRGLGSAFIDGASPRHANPINDEIRDDERPRPPQPVFPPRRIVITWLQAILLVELTGVAIVLLCIVSALVVRSIVELVNWIVHTLLLVIGA